MDLLDWTPPDGHRDGKTYEPEFDFRRLNRQSRLVYDVISDGLWHTLSEIAERTEQPEASVSARLRDLRKERFGKHTIDRQRAGDGGLFRYRLANPKHPKCWDEE